MPKKTKAVSGTDIRALVDDFVVRLVSVVEADATRRVSSAVFAALGSTGGLSLPKRRGRPPKNVLLLAPGLAAAPSAPAKRRPKQLCPIPGCENPAAPVFGMVCAKHKDTPKAQIKKYREERRAAKVAAKPRRRAA